MLLSFSIGVQAQWKSAGNKIKTAWVENVDPVKVSPAYPHLGTEHSEWANRNGLWQYAIVTTHPPTTQRQRAEQQVNPDHTFELSARWIGALRIAVRPQLTFLFQLFDTSIFGAYFRIFGCDCNF